MIGFSRRGVRVLAAMALLPLVGARPVPPILTIARLQYDGGGDWYANPSSLPNLLAAIRQRTSLQVDKTEARRDIDGRQTLGLSVHSRHRSREHAFQ